VRFFRYRTQASEQAALVSRALAFGFTFALIIMISPAKAAMAVPTEGDEIFNPAEHDHSREKPLPLKTTPLPTNVNPADVPAGPMSDLPVTPGQVNITNEASLMKASTDQPDLTKLTGQASASALLGVAKGMTVNPLTRYKGPRLVYVELTIRNNSDQPIVLLGEGIRGQCADKTVYPLGFDKLTKLDSNVMSTKSKALVAGLGAASLGLTSCIAYEWMAPEEYRKRNPGTAVGRDRGRHEIEEGRFNRRVLLPQDETTGWVAFYETDAGTLSGLTVPLLLPPYTIISGSVLVPIYGINVALKAANQGAVDGKPTTIYSIK
jgi:hypothetical protein